MPTQHIFMLSAMTGLFAAVLLHRQAQETEMQEITSTAESVRMVAKALLLILPCQFLLKPHLLKGVPFVTAFLLMPIALLLQKRAIAWLAQMLRRKGHGADRVMIYGAGNSGRRLASRLLSASRLALHPAVIVDQDPRLVESCSLEMAYREQSQIAVQCSDVSARLIRELACDLVMISEAPEQEQMQHLHHEAARAGVRVVLSQISDIDDASILHPGFIEPWYYACGKRLLDVLGSSLLLILLSPILLVIALLIRVTSFGPVIFVQKRVGRNGVLFRMYKFRSMDRNAKRYERSPGTATDPRITTVGRWLRRFSLDELPQLANVFLGQMSLVGPRPEMPFIVRRYDARQRQRLSVTPGITGLWQLSRDRSYPIHENMHHDLHYIRYRSLALEAAILLHTVLFAMGAGI